MTLIINGQTENFETPPSSVQNLLDALGIDYPVLVELNGTALFQRDFTTQPLHDGDRIEVLRMVAGG